MAKFSAETVGDSRLDYDFRTFSGMNAEDFGQIPEPSDKMIEAFQDSIKVLSEEAGLDGVEDTDDLTEDELADIAEGLSFSDSQSKMAAIVADLCSQSPSTDQLLRLPFRTRQVFYKWIMKQVQDPELNASATKPSRSRRNGG